MLFLTQSQQVFIGRLIPSTSHVIQRLTQSLSSLDEESYSFNDINKHWIH